MLDEIINHQQHISSIIKSSLSCLTLIPVFIINIELIKGNNSKIF